MLKEINVSTIIEESLAFSFGLEKYKKIMLMVQKVDVSQDREFQKVFNGFYRVRRGRDWRTDFFSLFQEKKNIAPSFEEIITALYKMTGNVEASFSSKMIATLNDGMPIWDQYILENLGLKLNGHKQEKLMNAIAMYKDICDWYTSYLQTENAKECISKFDESLPKFSWLSEVKKIDCFLWSMR